MEQMEEELLKAKVKLQHVKMKGDKVHIQLYSMALNMLQMCSMLQTSILYSSQNFPLLLDLDFCPH